MSSTDTILIVALALAGFIFYRLHKARIAGSAGTAPAPGNPFTPPGASVVPLGQYVVQPDRQWLLIQPGQ